MNQKTPIMTILLLLAVVSVLGCSIIQPPAATPTPAPTTTATPEPTISPSTMPALFRPGVWPWPFDTSRNVTVRYTKRIYENNVQTFDIVDVYEYKVATLANGQPGTYFKKDWGVRFGEETTTVEGYFDLSGNPVAGTGIMKHYRNGAFQSQEPMTDEQFASFDKRQDVGLASATEYAGEESILANDYSYTAKKYVSPDGTKMIWIFQDDAFPVRMETRDGANRAVYEMEYIDYP